MGLYRTAEYRTGNIATYAILVMALVSFSGGEVVSGVLFVAAAAVLMPSMRRHIFRVPFPWLVGLSLLAAALLTLPRA